MGEEDAERGADKDHELVAVDGFRFPAVHVPGGLLSCFVEACLFLLPHEEGGGECLHGHHHMDLYPYAFPGLLGRVFQTPVLLGVPEQVVLDEASIIVAIKGDKRIFHVTVGYHHDLFINAEQLFWAHSSITGYEETKRLAQQLDRWEDMRPRLMNRLKESRQSALIMEIHLLEGEIDAALKALRHSPGGFGGWAGSQLSVRVARAAESSRPHEAITLYMEAADCIVKARDRRNYARAVGYLGRVRALYPGLGEEKTWQSFIAGFREKNRRLSALKEELNRARM